MAGLKTSGGDHTLVLGEGFWAADLPSLAQEAERLAPPCPRAMAAKAAAAAVAAAAHPLGAAARRRVAGPASGPKPYECAGWADGCHHTI